MTSGKLLPAAGFYELQPLLVALTHNLGGDGDQLQRNLDGVQYEHELQEALEALRQTPAMQTTLTSPSGPVRLFCTTILTDKPSARLSDIHRGVMVRICVDVKKDADPVPVITLGGYGAGPGMAMFGGAFFANNNDLLTLKQEAFETFVEGVRWSVTEPLLEICAAGLAFFDEAPDLTEDARAVQQTLRFWVADALEDALNLPLTPQACSDLLTMFELVEDILRLPAGGATGPFTDYMAQSIQGLEVPTLSKISNNVLYKEAFDNVFLFGQCRMGEVHVPGIYLPLQGNGEYPPDTLNILFDDHIILALESGGFHLCPTGKAADNTFDPRLIKKLVTAGGEITEAQAHENKAFLIQSLEKFIRYAGTSKATMKTLRNILGLLQL